MISDTDQTTGLTMIDCGRWRRGDRVAADRAKDYLGERLGDITTLVVTHFDRDHWGGLMELAATHATLRPKNPPALAIHVAGLPDAFAKKLRAGMLSLISTRDHAPVNAIELLDAWRASGIEVEQMMHYAGEKFSANGLDWSVLWPPHQIPTEMGVRITTWLEELDEIAKEMADSGHGKLLDDLQQAYAEIERFDATVTRQQAFPDDPIWPPRVDRQGDESITPDDYLAHSIDPEHTDTEFTATPAAFKKRLKNLSQRMSALDNALSLVVTTDNGCFINFGDIEGDALEALLRADRVRGAYDVMFAPHHGTHATPDKFPSAWVCISQNGVEHHRKNHLHRSTHINTGRCISTWDRGHIDIDIDYWGAWLR